MYENMYATAIVRNVLKNRMLKNLFISLFLLLLYYLNKQPKIM